MPFAALPGQKPGTVLLEDYLIAYVPHAPFLLEQLKFQPPPYKQAPAACLAVGGVDYGTPKAAKGEWPPLPASMKEVAQLKSRGDVLVLTESQATVANVVAQLPKVGHAHLATHGFFEEKLLSEERQRVAKRLDHYEFQPTRGFEPVGLGLRHPLNYVGLVLAGANAGSGDERQGILTGESIVDLPLEGMQLAVLSACESGLGELTEGEGTQGLVRAFHISGCPNVVASLWNVNDTATAALMAKFYHEMWVRGRNPLEALREAQLTIFRRPDLIASLAGDRGRPQQDQAIRLPLTAPDQAPPAEARRCPTRLWAAFILSGLGTNQKDSSSK
jgi:CHAT domain-containing protein